MRLQDILGLSAILAAACLSASAQKLPVSTPLPRTMNTARGVHDLPPDEASRAYPVRLRVVVTYYDPYIDLRHGAIFAVDATGGVFISVPGRPILPLKAGTLVDVNGVTGKGDYAPVIAGAQVRVVGQSHLPANAVQATLTRLLTGALDCQWVEIEGRVRSVHLSPHDVAVEIATSGGSLTAVTVREDGVDYESLVDSLVRLRGNAAPVFNQRRQMVGAHVFFPSVHEVKVIVPAPKDPFEVAAVPVSELFRYSPNPGLLHRVHVQGEVTLDWSGRILCIQSGNDGICMQTTQAARVPVGSRVDVVGFPAISLLKPTLEDAIFRTVGSSVSPPEPVPVTADRAMAADLDGKLVEIDAELIGQDLAAAQPTLMLRAGHVLFRAILPKDAIGAGLPWKDGSLVRVTGVSNVQVDSLSTNMGEGAVRPDSVQVLLRSVDDVTVLHAPSWWTPERALQGFAIVGMVVLASFVWIVVLRHRVQVQTRALRGSEERLRHLSEHDALTGLPNRILLNDRLQTALKRADRFETCLGVLMLDVDGFKEVNDALGHQAGDKLLCELAARLSRCVRATDTVARIGGDEFIILLPDLRVPAEAELIAGKIVAAAANPIEIDRAQATIHVSVGVVTSPGTGADAEMLLECADAAMYVAKEKGKNGFQVYRPQTAAFSGGVSQVPFSAPVPPTALL